jgi:hypothetical protein
MGNQATKRSFGKDLSNLNEGQVQSRKGGSSRFKTVFDIKRNARAAVISKIFPFTFYFYRMWIR